MLNYGGPEMDRLICETLWPGAPWFVSSPRSDSVIVWDGEPFMPSTNIKDAWEVVNLLRKDRKYANVMQRQEVAHCTFEDFDGLELCRAKADTAPMAICVAALRAMEAK